MKPHKVHYTLLWRGAQLEMIIVANFCTTIALAAQQSTRGLPALPAPCDGAQPQPGQPGRGATQGQNTGRLQPRPGATSLPGLLGKTFIEAALMIYNFGH